MRTFDLKQQFEAIKKSAVEALQHIFPIEGKTRRIVLDKVTVEDNLSSTDYTNQAKTKLKEGTWGVPVIASLTLIDKASNKVLDRGQKIKLFTLPKATDRFSYIVGGNEYQVNNQLRLRPGAYTIRQQNGELKTQVNLAQGRNFDLKFDEQKALFTITKVGGTQSNIPLYPVLLHLGVAPSKVSDAWGSRIASANISSDPKAIEKANEVFGAKKGLAEYFKNTQMDPDVSKMTLGQNFDRVSADMLVAASKKLLDVHLGKKEPEDRDSLQFKAIHSIDDFIKERIQKNKDSLEYRIKRTIDNPRRVKLSQIVNPGAFNTVIESFFTQDDKSNPGEQTNPLEMLAGQQRTTIMGAGGISSPHALTPDMREVHSSHFGFLDPTHSPESDRIGANGNLPIGVVKDGNELKKRVLDRNGKEAFITPAQSFNLKVAFPSQTGPRYKVLYKGEVKEVPKSEVDYFTVDPKMMFSWSSNLIPFLSSTQGNRSMMAAKHLEQAIALKNREAPLVQVKGTDHSTMEDLIGQHTTLKSPVDGVIKKIDKDHIHIKTAKGVEKISIYNNFPLNRKTFLNHEPVVKEGDIVKAGQLLADSNFTKGGTLALGTNLKVAYVPYKGLNFEDGIVISNTAAQKLTSEHIHRKTMSINDTMTINLNKFRVQYPNILNAKNADKLDADGVIKKGQRVEPGDIVIAALQERSPLEQVGVLSKALSKRPKNVSVEWGYEDGGIVTDVQKSGKNVTVYVKTEEAAKVGDKLSGRYGNKGVITAIVPDSDVPKDAKGNPVEILLNPHGIISRMNPGQLYDSSASKVAKATGKTYVVNNFDGSNNLKTIKDQLNKHGIPDKEELFDANGKSIGMVHTGNPYILKLFKQSQGNFSYRQGGPGSSYDANLQPQKQGGEESAKALDLLSMYAMLAHGAKANLKDMVTVKANQNDEYWNALKSGQQLPPPKPTFVYEKFINYLKGAGIDTKKDGSKVTLAPMLDKEIMKLSQGEVKDPRFFRGKDMKPVKEGFLDPVKFGGFKGTKWGHIKLKEPVVNPVFEGAVRKLTGLGNKYDSIVNGELHVDDEGKINKEQRGVTGGKAIEKLLNKIDVDLHIKSLETRIKKVKGDQLDDANKKLRILYALKEHKMTPSEAYIRKVVPVVPPVFRPIYTLADGNVTTADSNLYYQNIGVLNNLSKLPVYDMLPEEDKASLRKDINEHVKGLTGLVDLNIKGKPRQGFISDIKGGQGGQPKEGFFISKVLNKKQDYVGRATILPETSLHIDEAAIPEKMAWKIFEPFIVRELGRSGKSPNEAMKEIKGQTTAAKRALEIVMRDRKVILKRDPVLHKFNIMAFKPVLTSGTSLKIPPLVTRGFNADFDGDHQLTSILTFASNDCIKNLTELLGKDFIQERTMTARFKELIPIINYEGEFLMFHLSEFPHGDIITSKEGKNGRIDFYSVPQGLYVISNDEQKYDPILTEVTNWSVHHDRIIEIVNLKSGKQIVTDDDPRAVYGIKPGTLEFTRATPRDSIGMMIPTLSRLNNFNSTVEELPLDFERGYIFGAAASNGWAETLYGNLTGYVFLCNYDDVCGETFLKFCKEVYQYENSSLKYHRPKGQESTYGASKKWGFLSTIAAKELRNAIGMGASNKHLPPDFLSRSKTYRLGILSGLMDNDGGVGISHAKKKPQLMLNYSSVSIRLVQEVQMLLRSLNIKSRITPSKTPAGTPFWMLNISTVDFKNCNGIQMYSNEKINKIKNTTVNPASPASMAIDILPIPETLVTQILKRIGIPRCAHKDQKCLYTILLKSKKTGFVTRFTANKLLSTEQTLKFYELPEWEPWKKITNATNITWDVVESYIQTDIRETGYDLTVPGYETFMSVDGVILSNTMMVHVPISNEANAEAEKMLPSRNLYQPGTGKLMVAPSQEAQIGIYYLSKTSAGRSKLNSWLPNKYKVTGELNAKTTKDMLQRISKELPAPEFAKVVGNLKSEGEKHAYESGFTIGLSDLPDMTKERDRLMKGLTGGTDKSSENMNKAIDNIMSKKLKGKNNPLYDMVESGARGSSSNLRGIMFSQGYVSDAKGKIIPQVIKKSYAEGLDPHEFWTASYGARRGMIDRSVQTSLPGAFSKDILANTIDNVVSDTDCGTTKGIVLPSNSREVYGRYLAVDQAGLKRNTLVDQRTATELSKKTKTVVVRSPLTCLKPKGVCSKCYGTNEHGHDAEVGENVGAKSGQAIAEPLTQLVLNSFHTGGAAGTGADVTGYQRISQLMKMPALVVGSTSLAPTDGVIKKIVKTPAGGYEITINDAVVHISRGLALKVKQGDKVKKGTPLSEGVIKPQDMVKLKGMLPTQEYLVDELHKAYAQQGQHIDRKTFETVVRSVANTTKVLNNPKHSNWIPGDIIPHTLAQHYNENLIREIPLEEADGHVLAKGMGGLKEGHELTQKDIKSLTSAGQKTVHVKLEPLEHGPILKGVNQLPLVRKDWMAALGYRNLSDALLEGASQSWQTDLSDYHPIPALAHGSTFGKGEKGKY